MKISPVRARIHGALAMVALLLLVVGSPAALVAWGHLDATTVLSPAGWLAPDDGSIFLTVVTVIGWAAWTVFCVCVVAEAVGMATSQRHHVKLPGLGAIQGIAAGLLVASLTVLSPLTRSAVPPAPVSLVATAAAAPQPAPEAQVDSDSRHDEDVMTVTVGPHDDLWTLAETWYGDGTSWRRIVAANPDVDVDHLVVGQRLALPGATVTVPAGHTGAGRPIDTEQLNQIAPRRRCRKFGPSRSSKETPLAGLLKHSWGMHRPGQQSGISTRGSSRTPTTSSQVGNWSCRTPQLWTSGHLTSTPMSKAASGKNRPLPRLRPPRALRPCYLKGVATPRPP